MPAEMTLAATADQASPLRTLRPALLVLFLVYLAIGLGLPVIPMHLQQTHHLGAGSVGLVAGSLFGSSVLLRMWAGRWVDERGARNAVGLGLWFGLAAAASHLISWGCSFHTPTSVVALTVAQVLMGAASSFAATGVLGWGVSMLGPARAGLVMSWAGTAMFMAFALGAPAGSMLWHNLGFGLWASALALLAGLALLASRHMPSTPTHPAATSDPNQVTAGMWSVVALPGLGLSMASVGFASVTAFSAWLYKEHGWEMGWQAVSAFSISVVFARVALGHLPDRWGGARVAMVCAGLETAGLLLVGLATSPGGAVLGATLAGMGFGLVFPALGVVAVHRAAPQRRGTAMGLYAAFLDLALGLASPLLGLVAGAKGMEAVFLAAAMCTAAAAAIALGLTSIGTSSESG